MNIQINAQKLQKDIRILFLEEFIKRLIINSLKEHQKIKKEDAMLDKLEKASIKIPNIDTKPRPEQNVKIKKDEMQVSLSMQVKNLQLSQQTAPKIIEIEKAPEKQTITILDRLNQILLDPAVRNIICPGPEKNILINRAGISQTIQLSFSSADINNFMKEISEKTKIPAVPGLFKVVYQNFIITAIISEFVGIKFIIEKRSLGFIPAMPIKAQFK